MGKVFLSFAMKKGKRPVFASRSHPPTSPPHRRVGGAVDEGMRAKLGRFSQCLVVSCSPRMTRAASARRITLARQRPRAVSSRLRTTKIKHSDNDLLARQFVASGQGRALRFKLGSEGDQGNLGAVWIRRARSKRSVQLFSSTQPDALRLSPAQSSHTPACTQLGAGWG